MKDTPDKSTFENTARYVAFSLFRSMRRYWLVMLGIFLLLEGISYIHVINQPHLFQSTALLRVVQEKSEDAEGAFQIVTTQIADRVNQTLSSIAVQPTTFDIIRRNTDLDLSDNTFRSKVKAQPIKGTEFIEISITDQDPQKTQILANAFAKALQERHQDLSRDAPTGTNIQIVERAREPSRASSFPKRSRFFALTVAAALTALLIGYLLARFNRRIESSEDLTSDLDLPCLESISKYKKGPLSTTITRDAYQNLASTIKRRAFADDNQVLSVTGTRPGEGKSFTIANIATALGENGDQVILVDMDVRHPSLHYLFEIDDPEAGIGPAIIHNKPFPKPQSTNYSNVSLIPAGNVDHSFTSRIYESDRLKDLLVHLPQDTDKTTWLLIDLPPILAAPGTVAAAVTFKNTLFVTRAGVTRIRDARHSIASLLESNVNIIGGVLTAATSNRHNYASYYSNPSKLQQTKTSTYSQNTSE